MWIKTHSPVDAFKNEQMKVYKLDDSNEKDHGFNRYSYQQNLSIQSNGLTDSINWIDPFNLTDRLIQSINE